MMLAENILKKFLLGFLMFIAGFILGISGKLVYENSVQKPYGWKNLPIVVNCYGPGLDELQVIQAIDYWTMRGEKIGFYEHNPPQSICKKDIWVYGFIIIRKAKMLDIKDPSVLAQTRRYTSLNEIKGAVITYRPGKQNLEIIHEHEFGHAFGYTHVEQIGHVMHPVYDKMGKDFIVNQESGLKPLE